MKIGIHHRKGSFSDYWIEYCKENNLEYKIVNAFDSDIVEQLRDCDVFMWHHHHAISRDVLLAKQLLTTLQLSGKVVYPDIITGFSFDDKVAQKYLFESFDIPTVPAYAFYDKNTALKWAETTDYPKVFKLKGGAGSSNVKLIKSAKQAKKIIKRSFNSGFSSFNRKEGLKDRFSNWKSGKANFISMLKGIYRFFDVPKDVRLLPDHKGYVYFQEFMPDNSFDTRVVVIGGKYAFAEKRYVREGDFRASGSGAFDYSDIDPNIIKSAFDAAKKLKVQSVAFDFIYDGNHQPLVVEMSYAFGTHGISHAPEYWTDDMTIHKNTPDLVGKLIIEEVIKSHKLA